MINQRIHMPTSTLMNARLMMVVSGITMLGFVERSLEKQQARRARQISAEELASRELVLLLAGTLIPANRIYSWIIISMKTRRCSLVKPSR